MVQSAIIGTDPDFSPNPVSGCRRLAAAVIDQAISDAASRTIDIRAIQSARTFLFEAADDLGFWCEVAGLDPCAVMARAARAVAQRVRRPTEAA